MSNNASMNNGALHLNVRLHKFGSKFKGSFPDFGKPDPIGFYGINEERDFQDNANNLSYFCPPPPRSLPLNLNAGIENVQRKGIDPDYHDIYQFCQYIYNHQDLLRTTPSGRLELATDIVTFRGILRLIMCTPYQTLDDYRLMAMRLNGTIYISKVETEVQRLERAQMTQRHLDMCSWGFKFEQYCTSANPNIAPDTSLPVNECKEFACVYRTKVDGLRVWYGAEMDCIRSDKIVNLDDAQQLRAAEFVELKTTAFNMSHKQKRTFDNYKSQNWWSQSFLVGIKTIVAGLRDTNGLLQDIKEYNVSDLHRNKPWSAAAMCTFLSNFLTEVKALMEGIDDRHTVVILDYKADLGKVLYTLDKHVKPVLPDWYRQLLHGSDNG